MSRFRSPLPIRLRLTLWYTAAFGLILLLLGTFIYFQVRRVLLDQADATLELAAAQVLPTVVDHDGRLELGADWSGTSATLPDDLVIRLTDSDGQTTILSRSEMPDISFVTEDGVRTLTLDGDQWRVYTRTILVGRAAGQIQIIRELEPILLALVALRLQLFIGLPLALALAAVGGYLLAGRALAPVDRMTRTAASISAGDLSRRIQYEGAEDEIGRLAQTFDAMLDRLSAAFARERRFTGDAAHELRTPLTAMKGQVDVALSRSRSAADYRQVLAAVGAEIDRLADLSNALLLVSRLDQGGYPLQPEPLDPSLLVGAALDQMTPQADARSITLVDDTRPGLTIQGNINLLIRLLLNLLDNAIKYTPPGGQVTVTVTETGDGVGLAVADTGPGISPEHLPHLFDRFYRAEADRARDGTQMPGGSGLGLAIAREIALLHGGALTADSVLGQGTTMTLTLPAS